MKQFANYIARQVGKKVLLWLGSSLGLSFFAIVGVLLLVIILIVGAVGGSVSNNTSVGGNGLSACSVTGEIDQASWDAAFENAGAFTGKGDLFIELAQLNGIDPVLAAAIAFHETGRGTSNAVVNKNNPGGIMDPSTNWSKLMHFSSLEEGLSYTMANLKRRIIDDGLSTIETLGSVYAPIGAANDPNGLNANWVPIVTKFASELGGLTMNCSVIGDQVAGNEAFKTILNEMLKYDGWSYVWAGYTPSMGFDCSGLMQWAYKLAGINLPRTSYSQYQFAQKITKDQLQPGDLIFFKSASYAPVTHVGMYVGNGMMFDSNNSGVGYSNPFDSYWGSIIVGYGRVADFSE
ncbi:MAG: NlpC/P60 family protein [Lysinibacillus sp.]